MKKLRLSLDSLEVQTFETRAALAARRGTVQGLAATVDPAVCASYEDGCNVASPGGTANSYAAQCCG